jgi:CRP-like cAMP-binding protein
LTENKTRAEDLIAKVSLFARLPKKSLKKLAGLSVPRSYPPDTVMIREGTTGLGLFLITSGSVEIHKGEGDSKVSLGIAGPGDILGEMALIDDQLRSATAVSREPTECFLITRDSFQTLVKKDPDIAWCIVPALVERLRSQQSQILAAETSSGQGEAAKAHPQPEPSFESEASEREQTEASGGSQGSTLSKLLQVEYALVMAGVAGLGGTVKLLETFASRLARETGIEENEDPIEVARKLPKGLVSAARSVLTESEKLPEKMLTRFRRTMKRD